MEQLTAAMLLADDDTRRKLMEQVITSCNSVLASKPLIIKMSAERQRS
jgi:hypothetical protein